MAGTRKSPELTQDRMRELLSFDPATGVFTWRMSRGKASAGSVAGKLRETGRQIGIDGVNYTAARLAWFWVHGEWPTRILRFKDGNSDNAAITNLAYGEHDHTTQAGKTAYQKEWRKANPRSQRHLILKRGYGMSVQDYAALLEKQNGVCACCGKPETAILKGVILPLSVDHDHGTGVVRGLLCQRCNHMLGHAKDDPAILRAGAAYLESHASKPETNVISLAGRNIAGRGGE